MKRVKESLWGCVRVVKGEEEKVSGEAVEREEEEEDKEGRGRRRRREGGKVQRPV